MCQNIINIYSVFHKKVNSLELLHLLIGKGITQMYIRLYVAIQIHRSSSKPQGSFFGKEKR